MAGPTFTNLGPVPLTVGALVLLIVAALLIGFAKTAIGGVALISVAIFAAVLPSRASTGIVLPLLLVGDVFAVRSYHQHADFKTLIRLIPAVAVGIGLGVIFVSRVDDAFMRHTIGAVLLALVALHLMMQRRAQRTTGPAGTTSEAEPPPNNVAAQVKAWGFGSMAGFTTMVANAGGPAMALYLLASRFSVLGYLGTMAWFFFLVNLIKVPFAVGLGLINTHSLLLNAVLAPAVIAGAWVGRKIIPRIPRERFEQLVLITTVLSALNLMR